MGDFLKFSKDPDTLGNKLGEIAELDIKAGKKISKIIVKEHTETFYGAAVDLNSFKLYADGEEVISSVEGERIVAEFDSKLVNLIKLERPGLNENDFYLYTTILVFNDDLNREVIIYSDDNIEEFDDLNPEILPLPYSEKERLEYYTASGSILSNFYKIVNGRFQLKSDETPMPDIENLVNFRGQYAYFYKNNARTKSSDSVIKPNRLYTYSKIRTAKDLADIETVLDSIDFLTNKKVITSGFENCKISGEIRGSISIIRANEDDVFSTTIQLINSNNSTIGTIFLNNMGIVLDINKIKSLAESDIVPSQRIVNGVISGINKDGKEVPILAENGEVIRGAFRKDSNISVYRYENGLVSGIIEGEFVEGEFNEDYNGWIFKKTNSVKESFISDKPGEIKIFSDVSVSYTDGAISFSKAVSDISFIKILTNSLISEIKIDDTIIYRNNNENLVKKIIPLPLDSNDSLSFKPGKLFMSSIHEK